MKKTRIKTNVYLILLIALYELLPIINATQNKLITLVYYIIQVLVMNILYKRYTK